jgi:N-acetylglucosaminyldiphosphoundecaprenol N-acetyl-beta-D-mannosaminyltransferase
MNNTVIDSCFFKGVKINIINLDILNCFDFENSIKETNYFCVTDVGNVVNAYKRSRMLKEAINGSSISLPDGKPLSVFGKLIGFKDIGRTSGADVMHCLFKLSLEKGYSHCFIGDTEELLEKLINKIKSEYTNLKIKGYYSPPFSEWNKEKNEKIINIINKFDADFIWISFGGGTQEIWMYENFSKINRGILIGIGAGFRWFLGEIKQAPRFLQKLSMEWLFRLMQQPRKMFTRYMTTLPFFAKDAVIELIKIKIFGKKIS